MRSIATKSELAMHSMQHPSKFDIIKREPTGNPILNSVSHVHRSRQQFSASSNLKWKTFRNDEVGFLIFKVTIWVLSLIQRQILLHRQISNDFNLTGRFRLDSSPTSSRRESAHDDEILREWFGTRHRRGMHRPQKSCRLDRSSDPQRAINR